MYRIRDYGRHWHCENEDVFENWAELDYYSIALFFMQEVNYNM